MRPGDPSAQRQHGIGTDPKTRSKRAPSSLGRNRSHLTGRIAERWMVGTADPATAIDEGVKHYVEELVGELEGGVLRTGCGFAGNELGPGHC